MQLTNMQLKRSIGLTLVSVMGVGTPALADLTPEQVWGVFEQSRSENGIDVTGQKSESGDTLTVTDITMSQPLSDNSGTSRVTLSGLSFIQQGDGSVAVKCPEEQKMAVETDLTDGDDVKVVLAVDCAQMDIIVSGTPESFTTQFEGPSFGITVEDPGKQSSDIELKDLELTLSGIKGQTDYAMQSDFHVKQSFTAESGRYKIQMGDPQKNTEVSTETIGQDISFDGEFNFKAGVNAADTQAALREMAFSGTYNAGQSVTSFLSTQDGKRQFAGRAGATKAAGEISVKDGVVELAGETEGGLLNISAGAPLPIELQLAEAATNFKMPILPSDDPQGFAFGLELRDAKIPDVIWALFDPQGNLPRDPFTLALQFDGTALMSADLSNPETAKEVEAGTKSVGQIESLNISKLFLEALGAELTGSGKLTFENEDPGSATATPPIPDGTVELTLSGSEALIDKLISSGFVTEDQAMGARMMLGMFTRPGAGPDTLMSEFEFKANGQIMANGQRIK